MYLILAVFNFIFLMEIEEGNTKVSTKYQTVNEQLERARMIPKLFFICATCEGVSCFFCVLKE